MSSTRNHSFAARKLQLQLAARKLQWQRAAWRCELKSNARFRQARAAHYCTTGGAGGAPKLGMNVLTRASVAEMSQVSSCLLMRPAWSSV